MRLPRALVPVGLALALAGCATAGMQAATTSDSLDAAARDYVVLELAIGTKEDGYIDAYYGPEALKAQALAEAPSLDLPALRERAAALRARVEALTPADVDSPQVWRARYLIAQLTAAITRLRMMQGETLSFQDEAEGLFGVRPRLVDLATLDPVLVKIEALVPGKGPLEARVSTFEKQFDIPDDRLQPVLEAAIAECKRRTEDHLALPAGERFDLALVKGKPWSGYNYYKGRFHSRIEINTDVPVSLFRAIDLGCHEGYPGHHVYNLLLEQNLVERQGRVEMTVYPLFSPQSLISEGSANYGIELAFPGNEGADFATRVLAPLAGLPAGDVARYITLQEAKKGLSGARSTIAALWLAGTIDETEAMRLTRRYSLVDDAKARQSLKFAKAYRSYIINYGLGEDMVRHDVESVGEGEAERWARFEAILSEATLPSDLN